MRKKLSVKMNFHGKNILLSNKKNKTGILGNSLQRIT